MGFNQHQYGNIHACWIEDGFICQETSCTHVVYKYPTNLAVNLPKQVNLFFSFTVAFLLYDAERMYVGRNDGIISIYRRSDNLLVGMNSWEAPGFPPLCTIGFFNTPNGLREVYLDTRDRRSLYMKWRRIEASLERPFTADYTDIFDPEAMAPAPTFDKWCLYTKGGDRIGIDVWFVQDDVGKQNCAVFL